MNWCQAHWDQLRLAVKAKGLEQFGAQDAQEAAAQMLAEIEGEAETFDPLLGSYWRINNAMAESLQRLGRGNEVLQLKCPLCILVDDGQPHLVENWIDGVTDSAKAYAIEQGLVKPS